MPHNSNKMTKTLLTEFTVWAKSKCFGHLANLPHLLSPKAALAECLLCSWEKKVWYIFFPSNINLASSTTSFKSDQILPSQWGTLCSIECFKPHNPKPISWHCWYFLLSFFSFYSMYHLLMYFMCLLKCISFLSFSHLNISFIRARILGY